MIAWYRQQYMGFLTTLGHWYKCQVAHSVKPLLSLNVLPAEEALDAIPFIYYQFQDMIYQHLNKHRTSKIKCSISIEFHGATMRVIHPTAAHR